jgi:hypothetical protein
MNRIRPVLFDMINRIFGALTRKRMPYSTANNAQSAKSSEYRMEPIAGVL